METQKTIQQESQLKFTMKIKNSSEIELTCNLKAVK